MPAIRWLVPVLAVATVVTYAPPSFAQDKSKVQSEVIQFETADGVQIQGTYYQAIVTNDDKIVAANDVGDAPVVMLLHPFGGNPEAKEWDGLAVVLASRGFHVLRFDFRGHGKSTVISKSFWDDISFPENTKAFPRQARSRPLPLKLETAQVKKSPGYFPMLVNDIIAARIALDKMNDDGKLNSATVYMIGAGDAAFLGMMYMTAEWTRPQKPSEDAAAFIRTLPPPPALQPNPRESAGRDIAAAIWVAPSSPAAISERMVQRHYSDWVKLFPDMRDSNAILCLAGDGDLSGRRMSKMIVDDVFVAQPGPSSRLNKLPFTVAREIKGSKLTGVDLLNSTKAPDTEKQILDYLTAIEKDRKSVTKVVNRNYNIPPYLSPNFLGVVVR